MSSPINATAAAGWSGRGAEDYELGRPGYPRAAVELVGSELGLGPEMCVVDLAAGTGKLTRELAPALPGVEVVAVEPVAAMRAQLAAAVPGVEVLEGRAESIPLGDGTVHAVFVAQAFHWFDVAAAAAEIARVLDDRGGLAIVRNVWDDDAPEAWVAELRAFIHEHSPGAHSHARAWSDRLDATGRFEPFQERTLANDQRSDLDGLVHRVASMSYIAALPDAQRTALLDETEALLRRHGLAAGATVVIPTRTVVRWAAPRRARG